VARTVVVAPSSIASLEIRLTGVTPFVMENPRMADPEDEFKIAVSKLTAKGSRKTEDDHRAINHLQFLGLLYMSANGDGPIVRTGNMRRCWIDQARSSRHGEDLIRGLSFDTVDVPLEYDGPRDAEALEKDPRFSFITTVNGNPGRKNKTRVSRRRPMFPGWSLTVPCTLKEKYLSVEDFTEIVHEAGEIQGLGGAHTIGFGRYSAEVKEL
jgi:hypothetical protein